MARKEKNAAFRPDLQDALKEGVDNAMNRIPPDEYMDRYTDKVSNWSPGQKDPTTPGHERIDWLKIPRR